MIGAYFLVSLVFAMVLSYLWLINHFWLRDVFKEDHKPSAHTRKCQATLAQGTARVLRSGALRENVVAAIPESEVKSGIEREFF